jgi:hypothetical protein
MSPIPQMMQRNDPNPFGNGDHFRGDSLRGLAERTRLSERERGSESE